MPSTKRAGLIAYSTLLSLAIACPAFAFTQKAAAGLAASTATVSADAPKAELTGGLSAEELAALSGGDNSIAVAISNQNLTAVSSGNQVNAQGSVVTGSIALTQSAFSNFNGLGNIVLNTGNNNTIQTTLSVSVVMPQH